MMGNNPSGNIAQDSASNNNIEYRGDGIDVERDFQNTFNSKFALLRALIMKQLKETVPVLKLSKEEGKRLIKYAQDTYFRHMRLYEFVFNNNSENEMKRINFK